MMRAGIEPKFRRFRYFRGLKNIDSSFFLVVREKVSLSLATLLKEAG